MSTKPRTDRHSERAGAGGGAYPSAPRGRSNPSSMRHRFERRWQQHGLVSAYLPMPAGYLKQGEKGDPRQLAAPLDDPLIRSGLPPSFPAPPPTLALDACHCRLSAALGGRRPDRPRPHGPWREWRPHLRKRPDDCPAVRGWEAAMRQDQNPALIFSNSASWRSRSCGSFGTCGRVGASTAPRPAVSSSSGDFSAMPLTLVWP